MNLSKSHLPCAVVGLLMSFLLASCAAQYPGYTYYPNYGYYKLHTVVANWGDAWDICRLEGGHLAIINSDEEAFVLSGIFAQGSVADWCLVGFHDLYKTGQYVTVYGIPLEETGYVKWFAGEPNRSDENCGAISHQGLLCDIGCNFNHPFMCEIDLPT